jgi:hemin uptake protein HemP
VVRIAAKENAMSGLDTGSQQPTKQPDEQAARIIQAIELFRGQREIWIEHDGQRYRLRLTRRNKLILQK